VRYGTFQYSVTDALNPQVGSGTGNRVLSIVLNSDLFGSVTSGHPGVGLLGFGSL